MLPALRRAKNIAPQQLEEWTIDAFENELSVEGIDLEKIEKCWRDLPRSLRKSTPLILARIKALVACGETSLAETTIRKTLKTEWNDDMVRLYGEMDHSDNAAQLRQIEIWLNKRPEDAGLLLAAGRACIHNQLWAKARSYLESSVAIRPSPAAYHELGQLMLKLDEPQAATEAFSRGLTLSNTGSTDLPRLANDP